MKNNLYRIVMMLDNDIAEYQCLSCKEKFYFNDSKIINYCPICSNEFKKYFDKKNKRYYSSRFKQHYPRVIFFRYITMNKALHPDSFCTIDIKPYQKWEYCSSVGMVLPERDGRKFPELFKQTVCWLRQIYPEDIIKYVIDRWDGSTKEYELRKNR